VVTPNRISSAAP